MHIKQQPFIAVLLLIGGYASIAVAQDIPSSSAGNLPVVSLAKQSDMESDSTATEDSEPEEIESDADENRKVEGKQVFHALMALTSDDPIDGATAITILIVGSFVVYRISTFLVWLITMTWPRLLPNPDNIPAEKFLKREMAIHAPIRLYYLIAALVALILQVVFCEIQLLGALGFETQFPMLDCVFTAAIMVVGAKRVAQWLDLPAIPGDPVESKPVEVTGEVVLRDSVSS